MNTVNPMFQAVLSDFSQHVQRDEVTEKQRDDAREVWAEMTADMRAHEAGE